MLFNELFEKKDLWLLANKLIEKIPHPCNAKEHCQSFIRKKNTKSEILTYQPKTFKNPDVVDIKSVITEHPKTSHKLSKAEKVCSNSFCIMIQKSRNFLNEKNVKVTKRKHAFKGFASSYNAEILNSFTLTYKLKILILQLKMS